MSCNTPCPCISSVWEQYSKILHKATLKILFVLSSDWWIIGSTPKHDINTGFDTNFQGILVRRTTTYRAFLYLLNYDINKVLDDIKYTAVVVKLTRGSPELVSLAYKKVCKKHFYNNLPQVHSKPKYSRAK